MGSFNLQISRQGENCKQYKDQHASHLEPPFGSFVFPPRLCIYFLYFDSRKCYKSVVVAPLIMVTASPATLASATQSNVQLPLPGIPLPYSPYSSCIYPKNPVNQKRAQISQGESQICLAFRIHYLCADRETDRQTDRGTSSNPRKVELRKNGNTFGDQGSTRGVQSNP